MRSTEVSMRPTKASVRPTKASVRPTKASVRPIKAAARRRLVLAVVVAAGMAWAAPLAAVAQEAAGSGTARTHVGGFYVGMGLMQAWGDAGFTTSGRDAILGPFSSVLEFPMDATYLVLESGIDELGGGFGVRLRYGSSMSLDGTTVDTDYAWRAGTLPYVKSLSDTEGDNVFLTLDVTYRLYDRPAAPVESGGGVRLDAFAGYQLQDASFEVSDVNTVIERMLPADDFLSGLGATYDMQFWGLRLGLRGDIELGPWGAISASVAVLPYVDADGRGRWMVREKTLDHDATGWGLDLAVRYEYAVSPSIRLWGGAGYTRFTCSGGTDTEYEFDGRLIGRGSLDEIKSDYGFVMIGGEFRF